MTAHDSVAKEKMIAGLVTVGALALAIFFTRERRYIETDKENPADRFSPRGEIHRATAYDSCDRFVAAWTDLRDQARAARGYDLFSAPEVYYDPKLHTYCTRRAADASDPASGDGSGGASASIRAVPFRLQLVGYVGSRAHLRGVFENVATGETLIAGRGQRLAGVGLVVDEVILADPVAILDDEASSGGMVATAFVRDEHDPRLRVALTNVARSYVTAAPASGLGTNEPASHSGLEENPGVVSDPAVRRVGPARIVPSSGQSPVPDTADTPVVHPGAATAGSEFADFLPPNA